MKEKILISWLGRNEIDFAYSHPTAVKPFGPITSALNEMNFDHVYLLSSFNQELIARFTSCLKNLSCPNPLITEAELSSPMNFEQIYKATVNICSLVNSKHPEAALIYLISSGTSAMAAVIILIARTLYPGEIIQTSAEHGVNGVSIPFDISVDYVPRLFENADARISANASATVPGFAEFSSVIHRSEEMVSAIRMAKKAAIRSIPILLEGESGTGKELFARAIHKASLKRSNPFIVVNCGAIPQNLVEAELYGYVKGSFTGAYRTKIGVIEAANGGTVFFDEISELPFEQQVKLLRAVQEKTIRKIGSTTDVSVDFRIIAASNKNLIIEVNKGRFREDLFYRLAVAVIKLPPLRERQGDVSLLAKHFLDEINKEHSESMAFKKKTLTPAALQLLYSYTWPGNVRELINTLQRAVLWSESENISKEQIESSILSTNNLQKLRSDQVKHEMLNHTFSMKDEILKDVRNWISIALDLSGGSKKEASQMLGMNNYQTLTNWMKRVDTT
jgi:transcriptional regulator with PAS, ATPase and Fis domain